MNSHHSLWFDESLRKASVVITLSLLCAGCSSFLDSELPAAVSYVLAPVPAAAKATASAASEVDLSIGRPDVAPGLDTQRIAVLRGRELDYYRGAQWGGTTLEMVQTLLVSSFQDQRLFRSVTSEQARVAGDYMLDIEVRDFQSEYATDKLNPNIRVGIVGRLIRIKDRRLIETVSANINSGANDNRLTAVIAAFEAAGQKVALELAQKTAAAVSTDRQRSVDDTATAARGNQR